MLTKKEFQSIIPSLRDYSDLKLYGFSAFKAAEIVDDVKRGDPLAIAVLKMARATAQNMVTP